MTAAALTRVGAVARRRREALERVDALNAEFVERVADARSSHEMAAIADAAGMSRANLYKVMKRRDA